MTQQNKLLVLMGVDKDGKHRAAKFSAIFEKAVHKLAGIHGFVVARADSDEGMEAALRLVDGKTFKAGTAPLPLITPATYETLSKTLSLEDRKPAEAEAGSKSKKIAPAPQTDPWAKIAESDTVLYHDNGTKGEKGWWEAVVLEASKDGRFLTLRWKHFPEMKPFAIKRSAAALLSPKS